MSVVVDSDVLIDVLRGIPAARAFLKDLGRPPVCSEVSRVEVLRGMRTSERRATEQLLSLVGWMWVDAEISGRAGELGRHYRQSHGAIGAADLIIAATAERLGIPLATRNVRHFPMFPGLEPAYRR
jgi:predicted nucleic acid-binding protein